MKLLVKLSALFYNMTMSTPSWIEEQNAEKKRAEAQQAERARRAVEVSAAMFLAQGHDVWKRFTDALKVAILFTLDVVLFVRNN